MEMSGNAIVFTNTCEATRFLALMLRNLGLRALPLNGQLTQDKRFGALKKFKAKECDILICTNVLSRGADIPVDMVINYDIPEDFKIYKHRVGRTARAGKSGVAISLVTQYTLERFDKIETMIGKKLPKRPVEDEEVMLLVERVAEAKRIAHMTMKESGGKKRRYDVEDEGEEIRKYMSYRSRSCKTFKKSRR